MVQLVEVQVSFVVDGVPCAPLFHDTGTQEILTSVLARNLRDVCKDDQP